MSKKETPQFIKDILHNVKHGIPPQDPHRFEDRFDYTTDTSSDIVNLQIALDYVAQPLTLPLDKIIYNQVGQELLEYFSSIKSLARLKNQFKVLLATLIMLEFDEVHSLTSIRSIMEVEYGTSLTNNTIISHLAQLQANGWVTMKLGYRMGKYGRFSVLEHIDVHDIFKV